MKLKQMFDAGRVLLGTAKRLKKQRTDAAELASLPLSEVLTRWLQSMNANAELWQGNARPPPEEGKIAACERQLGVALPGEVREFYRCCDGVAPLTEDFPHPILAVGELRLGGSCSPPLADQLNEQWSDWGRESGEPSVLAVFPPSALAVMADRPERCLPFEAADRLLPLVAPRDGACVAIVVEPGEYAPGTVLDIENLVATRYDSLKAWLAATATMMR
jgi:hypothetical protein